MPCWELRFVLSVVFYVVNENPQNRIRSKSCKSKRKHQKSEDFRCCSGAAGQIRTADLIITKKFAFILPCVRSCLYMPSGLCAIRIFVLSSLPSFYLVLGRLLETLFRILN